MADYDGPILLDEKNIEGVAKYIQSRDCKRIFVMTGAGISTSAGIPDFRSPETGLYANLARLNLPYPEAVFDIGFFRKNPLPCKYSIYTLAHELAPGKYRPTKTHSFIRLLHEKKYLHTCFTQNIDTLERRAGLPDGRIIEAHGSFASQRCIDCKKPFDDEEMKKSIKEKKVPRCKKCKGLVKPDIVFFGEALPAGFHKSIYNLVSADLLIVMGTSLTVHPFASLTGLVPKSCPRVLVNLDPAGDIGDRPDDVLLLGHCDDVVQKLCRLLGWEEELEALWAETAKSVDSEEVGSEPVLTSEEEVKKLAKEVGETLRINEHHLDAVTEEIRKKAVKDAVSKETDTETKVAISKDISTSEPTKTEVASDIKESKEEESKSDSSNKAGQSHKTSKE
ncbi:hypothetical protein M422DRAFT_221776 [Sphaerobolus stellatus SS14]|nr:hypothetical protein M422DRAFT_221776 [Sphaerobolus stellatus SS14]